MMQKVMAENIRRQNEQYFRNEKARNRGLFQKPLR